MDLLKRAIFAAFIFDLVYAQKHCESVLRIYQYYKIKSCHKSTMAMTAWTNVPTLKECMQFARQKNGLAFNFSPAEASTYMKMFIRNCQVLGCPEIGDSPTLVKDIAFDYYSAYGNWNTTENAICIKSVGLFKLTKEKQNYIESTEKCQNIGADLADVFSEERTNHLSEYIHSTIQEWYKAAYVGLDDMEEEGNFRTISGTMLRCFRYRAWSPGHPRSKHKDENCVILNSDKMWKVVPCKTKLQALCEFYPEGPSEGPLVDFQNIICDYILDEKKKRICKSKKAMFELYDHSTRIDKCAMVNYSDEENLENE